MRILLIDGTDMMRRFTAGPVANFSAKGELTGLRFGCLRGVRSYEKATKADSVVICYDAPTQRPEFTLSEDEPSYEDEQDRRKKINQQVEGFLEMMALTKYHQAWSPGEPATSIITAMTNQFHGAGHTIIINSKQQTLWPLIDARVMFWEKVDGKALYIGPGEVLQKTGKSVVALRASSIEPPTVTALNFVRGAKSTADLTNTLAYIEAKSLVDRVAEFTGEGLL